MNGVSTPPEVTDEETLAAIVREARVVAVIGMVDETKAHRPALEIPRMLIQRGMKVIPVNPRIQTSLGLTAYPDLASVPERFDPEDVPPHADEVLALPPDRRPRVFWMQTGIRNDAAAAKLAAAGIAVVMDHCLGV